MRFKQRYLLAQVIMEQGKSEVTSKDIYSAVTARILQLLGVWGFGATKASSLVSVSVGRLTNFQASLTIKYWNAATGYVIVRVTRGFARPVWVALSSVRELANRPCVFTVLHCGGTIRAAKLAQLKAQRLRMMIG